MIASVVCAALMMPSQTSKPNVIYILADDLGYGELGCYGQKVIQTPNIDRMAREGMFFTQHYSPSPVCAPTRCSVVTGQSTRISQIRDNKEYGDFTADGIEGQEPLRAGTFTIGSLMKEAGYRTAMVGKWGLGGPESTGLPNDLGFDYFYGYLCQRQAHNYYPVHLWENKTKDILGNPKFNAHQAFPKDADPNDPSAYAQYKGNVFSNDKMLEKTIKFIDESGNKPFFVYFAPTIPHVSLQVPDEALNQYNGKIDEEPYLGNRGYLPHIRPKSAYAAMISRLDGYVGQIMDTLKKKGLDENTLIMFTSDNGPTWVSGITPDMFDSASGLRGRKAQIWEGGIRIPMIARWPGKIKASTKTDLPSVQYDLMATLSDLTGDSIKAESDGVTFLPTLLGKSQPSRNYIYWEFPSHQGAQAVRFGNFKAIRFNRGQGEPLRSSFCLQSED
ncbi:MAG: arylsulfatase [Fimbriimonadaceae bacterium]